MTYRYRVRKTETKDLRITLPVLACDRLRYIGELLSNDDRNSVILKAITYLDQALCAASEGAEIVVHHKNGVREKLPPC